MRAFHTLRTKNADFDLDDFEIFTALLSALEWRRFNGEIFLVTDSVGKSFVDALKISFAWNGVDTSLDELDALHVDENIFWAGAKLFALQRQPIPSVMMDLDFIVWRSLNLERLGTSVAVIHREDRNLPCYPAEKFFRFKDGFALPEDLDWSLEPCNAALVYFGDGRFVKAYCDFAFEFMRHAEPPPDAQGWDLLPYMVFVEQRWLAMCAERCGTKVRALSTLAELFGAEQKFFTHVWGHKRFLRENPNAAEKFCRDCAARIAHDFPSHAKAFRRVARLEKFFR